MSSSWNEPGSSSFSIRSRAVYLPFACCFSTAFSEAWWIAASRSSCELRELLFVRLEGFLAHGRRESMRRRPRRARSAAARAHLQRRSPGARRRASRTSTRSARRFGGLARRSLRPDADARPWRASRARVRAPAGSVRRSSPSRVSLIALRGELSAARARGRALARALRLRLQRVGQQHADLAQVRAVLSAAATSTRTVGRPRAQAGDRAPSTVGGGVQPCDGERRRLGRRARRSARRTRR